MTAVLEQTRQVPRTRGLARTVPIVAVLVTAVGLGAAGTTAARADARERTVRQDAALEIRARPRRT
jgi:hypothetical protein